MTPCPYSSLAIADDAAILAADDNCPLTSPVCLLNKQCFLRTYNYRALVEMLSADYTELSAQTVANYSFAAVGNVTNYANATLGFDCGGGYVDLTKLVLPKMLNSTRASRPSIAMNRCKLRSLSPTIVWPSNLESLSLTDGQLSVLPPNLPPTLRMIRLGGNYIQDITRLRTLPLTYLDLRGNALTSLQDMSWPALTCLELSGNSALQSIKNLKLTNAIDYFGAVNTALGDISIDGTTYLALRRLVPSLVNFVQSGVASFNGNVASDSCGAINDAALQPLWSLESMYKWSVCVIPIKTPSPSDMPPSSQQSRNDWVVVAVAITALLALLGTGFVLYIRRRRYAEVETSDGLATELDVLEPIRISIRDLNYVEKLNEGAFGEIWRGSLRGRAVAIKRLLPNRGSVEDIRSFIAELELMNRYVPVPADRRFARCCVDSTS
ncbi:hypothetical protein SPRG_18115 [Saprolegnia parasitica CBS 223.65]|uniref:Protein kinase domain-containing protein n=1 Tax=Saprolegnia parasitica (strain CBS 223.65) TaxID=695850 RepID=A0A067BHZ7_SAPPC|nr:hypothetical protein SPRG_18115 [Saprolegnia parasitica CBS 223.65]KDO16355.1 hypothetical protein SPRG_18115 [Saprolegnia parasitica CBS 223.65]|eukprot:XP_012212937.1 hypothetical protein SPRG_18115 [Saprolegnia parasitica CBS 223.65]